MDRGKLLSSGHHVEHPAAASGAQREKLHALPYDLVPFQEITEAYARVAEFGARKYAPWNWSKGLSRVQLLGSLLRHAFAYLRGEERDKDSGLLHTDHILWNAASLAHNVHWGLEDGRRGEPPRPYKGDIPTAPEREFNIDNPASTIEDWVNYELDREPVITNQGISKDTDWNSHILRARKHEERVREALGDRG